MGNLVDRSVLQEKLEYDLQHYLKGRSSSVPFVEFDALTFAVERQVNDLNRKSNDRGVTADLARDAVAKFRLIQDDLSSLQLVDTPCLVEARHLIHSWLPPLTDVWEEVWRHCGFGPGTVFHAKTPHQRSLLWKIGAHQTVTPKAFGLSVSVIGEFYPRFASRIRGWSIVQGNRASHVPKDVKKCRQIAVEPSLNVFLQKGVGEYLLRLLRRRGVSDLVHGQALHRELVQDFNRWGTIDLSDASDRISTKVVRYLLPPDWFELLDSLRSHYMWIDGEWIKTESFSSQGNAFTFPLETMIFKAIALASAGEQCFVYGDDIIAPPYACPDICEALELCGFKVNVEKSYWGQHHGVLKFFRESCGEDTLYGFGVRPVYFRDPASDFSGVAALANRLYERWGLLPNVHDYLVSLIPPTERLIGPMTYTTSDPDGYGNVTARDYSSWLWEEILTDLGRPADRKIHWCPQIQTYLRTIKYWSSKVRDLPKRYILEDEDRLLAFLYSGNDVASPLSKSVKRVKTVVHFCSEAQGVGGV